MRDVERILVCLNIAGALWLGARHNSAWFVLAVVGFGLYLTITDRLLRRQISERAWPSEGYARFAFNTNLYFALKHLMLGAIVFAVSGSLIA
ncbi:hypothetical protein [Devosia sp.]|uniref:hypothetical protein n=1 Tax=Devosia sp. TaxID=1871048 RepID=UPI003A8D6C6B